MQILGTPHFQPSSSFSWASTAEPIHHDLLRQYTKRAQEILISHRACLPDDDRFRLIIEAAMEARGLFFVAAMAEPTSEDLDQYFDHFVILSVFGIAGTGSIDD
jgi:hypothetical protein